MNTEKPGLERITMKKIFGFMLDVFNLEKGLIYTIKELTIRPGKTLKTYLFEDRSKLVKPFRYLILSTTIMAFLTINYIGFENTGFLQGVEQGYESRAEEQGEDKERSAQKIKQVTKEFEFIFSKYYSAFIMFSAPFYALAFMWFMGLPKLNYAEHLVLTSYLLAQQSILNILMTPLIKFTSIGMTLYLLLSTIYMFYLFMQFFDYKFASGFFRTLGAYLIGSLIYMIVFASVVIVILLLKLS